MFRCGPCPHYPKWRQAEPSSDSLIRYQVYCECGEGRGGLLEYSYSVSSRSSTETLGRPFRTRKGPHWDFLSMWSHCGQSAVFPALQPCSLHGKLLFSHQSPAYMFPAFGCFSNTRPLLYHPTSFPGPFLVVALISSSQCPYLFVSLLHLSVGFQEQGLCLIHLCTSAC